MVREGNITSLLTWHEKDFAETTCTGLRKEKGPKDHRFYQILSGTENEVT